MEQIFARGRRQVEVIKLFVGSQRFHRSFAVIGRARRNSKRLGTESLSEWIVYSPSEANPWTRVKRNINGFAGDQS